MRKPQSAGASARPHGTISSTDEMQPPERCGAMTRSGKPCTSYPIAGRRRCRMHGGTNPGAPLGNTNAKRPGSLTSRFYTEEEQALVDSGELSLDNVDAELHMLQIRLLRELNREADEGADQLVVVEEIQRDGGPMAGVEQVKRRSDRHERILKLLAMQERYMRLRSDQLASAAQEGSNRTARIVLEIVDPEKSQIN